ncbi:MAG: hypothetical protein ABUL55_02605 [Pseudomonadota bacterium]
MSLNKTLNRFFDEIRREAKRNPAFADRLDAVLRVHDSQRDVADEVMAEMALPPAAGEVSPKATEGVALRSPKKAPPPSSSATRPTLPPQAGEEKRAPELNPVGLYTREGADALAAALADKDRAALMALVAEHHLDPGGEAEALDRDGLAEHIMAHAKRRAERDSKLFDY